MGHRVLVSIIFSLCAEAALAQVANTSVTSNTIDTSLPVAYVYVSRPTHINGYAAWSTGKLTPVPGSPFANTSVVKMSVTSKFLFGENADHNLITGYSIHSNGTLTKVSSINPTKYETGICEQSTYGTQVDATGSTLYFSFCILNEPGSAYLSFHINSSGDLQFLGGSAGGIGDAMQNSNLVLTMMGNNHFAFDSYCAEDDSDRPVIQTYKRESNGDLLFIGEENHMPEAAPGTAYCPSMSAADSTNHLAVAVQRIDSQPHDGGYIYGPLFLASYTADSSGNLTTTSTWENMPETTIANDFQVDAISIAPSNKFLAVGGREGFEVFHFNGSSPVTKFTEAMLPGVQITKFGWDKANHLYVLAAGYLHVYTVSSTSVKEASGSPYSIPESSNVIVRILQ